MKVPESAVGARRLKIRNEAKTGKKTKKSGNAKPARRSRDAWYMVSVSIYGATQIIPYEMSTIYHALRANRARRVFRVLDHDSVFLLIAVKPLYHSLGITGFALLILGGLSYSVGAILYALRNKLKYMHSIFHFFVVGGGVFHFFAILLFVV